MVIRNIQPLSRALSQTLSGCDFDKVCDKVPNLSNMKILSRYLVSLITLALLSIGLQSAQAVSATQRMGPTGVIAMIAGERAFNVKEIEKGSPADGKLWPGDQVVGAGMVPFLKRVRFEFATAVAQAQTEKNKGELVLMVRRKAGGKQLQRVTLQIGVYGADTFKDAAPYNCPKTDALITQAAEHLLKTKDYGKLNIGLLGLLATGDDKCIQAVREYLHGIDWAGPREPDSLVGNTSSFATWHWGYRALVLTEYYLLTRDEYVLPAIRAYAEGLAAGQDAAGLWGHRMHDPQTGRAFGYGTMNQPTMPVFISLILARKCGVDSPRISEAVQRSMDHYIHDFLNKGALPYGNHGPNPDAYNNNGSSGSLAIALAALGNVEGARFFSRMAMAGYNDMESGHATFFFNILWTGLGANIAGPEASAAFFKKTSWLCSLNHDWRGGYTYELGTDEDIGNTGSYLLNLCAGRRKLHITGRDVAPAIALNAAEIEETINVHKLLNDLIPMKIEPLLEIIDTHWSPKIRDAATTKLLKFKREEIEAIITKRLTENRDAASMAGVGRFWDKTPAIFDQVAIILRDRNVDLKSRIAASQVLGGAAWARFIEPEENFNQKDLWESGQLHKPALKYFPDLVQVIAEEEKDDPNGDLDRAAGLALASLGDPYQQKLITDKPLFYQAINRMLADKYSSQVRSLGMSLIAGGMPLEDFHYVADNVVQATRGTDRSYTQYRGGNATALGVQLLNRLNIKEVVQICIESFPTATRSKDMAARVALLASLGADAKPYLGNLKSMLENNAAGEGQAEGFTKDVPLKSDEIEAAVRNIENATNPRQMISLEEAKQAGLNKRE